MKQVLLSGKHAVDVWETTAPARLHSFSIAYRGAAPPFFYSCLVALLNRAERRRRP